jgi:predicted Fe-Mo cluster-binding NifX family protein
VPLSNQQEIAMKIAITTSGCTLDASVDNRFGRAPKFVIYDAELDTYHVKNNLQNLNAVQGAGIQTALNLCKEKVDCVVTGNCGPKAFETLSAAGIAVYTCGSITVQQAIDKVKRGELSAMQKANVEAHWI